MEDKKKCKCLYVLEPLILTSLVISYNIICIIIACCKRPGACNNKHCPCQKDNSSCGAHCGCSSDKCKNRKRRPIFLILTSLPPPSKRTRPNAPCIPTATPNNNNADSIDTSGSSNREDTTFLIRLLRQYQLILLPSLMLKILMSAKKVPLAELSITPRTATMLRQLLLLIIMIILDLPPSLQLLLLIFTAKKH